VDTDVRVCDSELQTVIVAVSTSSKADHQSKPLPIVTQITRQTLKLIFSPLSVEQNFKRLIAGVISFILLKTSSFQANLVLHIFYISMITDEI
jgi:hypothetical protein